MGKYIVVTTLCNNKEMADKIVDVLLNKNLELKDIYFMK